MRLPAFLCTVGLATGLYIPSREEKIAAWNKLNVVKNFHDGVPDEYTMVFVSPIWRHGDRGPADPFPGDVLTEDDWDFGGGGYGELSPLGMSQHYKLGQKLWDRYAAGGKFLSERYRAKEIYVRSTDYNRTMISAMSNMAGMYSRPDKAIKNTDYPADQNGWPSTYIPVPIHTVDRSTDHMGDPDLFCNRQKDLWKLVQQLPEYIHFDNLAKTQETYKYLREQTGGDETTINFDNMYKLKQGMLCESIHFPDNFSTWYPWYTEDVKQRVDEIDAKNIDFQNGIFASGEINGYDLTIELPRIRGGGMINDIFAHAAGVLDCYAYNKFGENNRCTENDKFLSNVKYYAISAHDSTVAAYLSTLEAKTSVITSGGYPSYSAAVITEFFIDTSSGSNDRLFRVLYHDDENADFRVITPFVSGCEIGHDFCAISNLQKLADKYSPGMPQEELCEIRVDGPAPSSSSSAAPAASTTKKADNSGSSTTTTTTTTPSTTTSSSSILFSFSALVLAKIIF